MSSEALAPLGLIAAGIWSEDQLDIRWIDEPSRPPSWETDVERDWKLLREQEPSLYDAPLAGFRGLLPAAPRIGLVLSRTTYRRSITTHHATAHYVSTYGLDGLGMGVACAIGLLLPSGGLLLGRRSQRVLGGRGSWHPTAGHFDPEAHCDAQGRPSPFATSRIEIFEELGVCPEELAGLSIVGVQIPPNIKPELHFTARVALPFPELERRQAGARDAHEMDALLELRPNQVDDFLAGKLGPATEIALGCVHLHRQLGLL